MINNYDVFIIGLVIVGCCIVTYSDIKYGKISNHIVLLYGAIPIVCNWINICFGDNWKGYMLTCAVAIFIAIFLYALHIWAGGDCKMIIFVTLSMPSSFYWSQEFAMFNLCIMYLFVFSYGFIYICFDDIRMLYLKKCDINTHNLLEIVKLSLYKYIIASTYIILIRYTIFILIISKYNLPLVIQNGIFIVVIFLISRFKFLYNKKLILIVLLLDTGLVLFNGTEYISNMFSVYLIALILIFVHIFSNLFNYEIVETNKVRKGMILSRDVSILMQYSRVRGLPRISDETLKSRLSDNEADAVIRWGKSKNGLARIKIVRRIPFAIFITMGLISYLAVRCMYF